MTLREAKRMFIDCAYENEKAYRKARKDDYCAVQLAWTYFMDSLVKDGLLTEKQFSIATF